MTLPAFETCQKLASVVVLGKEGHFWVVLWVVEQTLCCLGSTLADEMMWAVKAGIEVAAVVVVAVVEGLVAWSQQCSWIADRVVDVKTKLIVLTMKVGL